MDLAYCEKFGFDEERIRQRLRWLDLSEQDHVYVRRLQEEVIRPHGDAIIDDFYRWMGGVEEAQKLLDGGTIIACLKVTQTEYLRSLGVAFDTREYFESRLRVGQAHAWIGLSLSLYNCAYYWLSQFIIERFPPALWTPNGEGPKILACLRKIISLDVSLAIETYHVTQVVSLEEYLARSQRQRDHLRLVASTDALTGLANHDAIISELGAALSDVGRGERTVAVVMVDLDYFKAVNDTYGHPTGDKVLKEVSRRLCAALRGLDRVGRYGGEEFLLILNLARADRESVGAVAERVREHVTRHPIKLPDLSLDITMSMGVTIAEDDDTPESAIARADKALYAAKAAGRDCFIIE